MQFGKALPGSLIKGVKHKSWTVTLKNGTKSNLQLGFKNASKAKTRKLNLFWNCCSSIFFDEVKTFSSCHELDINLLPIVK